MFRLLPACCAVLVVGLAACSSSPSSSPPTPAPSTVVATVTVAGPSATTAPSSTVATGEPASSATTATTSPVTSTPIPATTTPRGVDPNAPEVVEPGDIPDNQVFIAYRPPDEPFSVKVPEGWAQTTTVDATTFTDHYNSITITATTASQAPSVDDVRNGGLSDVSSDKTFTLGDVSVVARRSGDVVLATYEIGSRPDPVTGKSALLAVERYEFFHDGTLVILTLSGAKGADNVDPWRDRHRLTDVDLTHGPPRRSRPLPLLPRRRRRDLRAARRLAADRRRRGRRRERTVGLRQVDAAALPRRARRARWRHGA